MRALDRFRVAINKSFCWRVGVIVRPIYCWRTNQRAASMSVPKRKSSIKLRVLADSGLGVLFVSSELEEVVAVSDRVLVLAAGREAGRLGADASVERYPDVSIFVKAA